MFNWLRRHSKPEIEVDPQTVTLTDVDEYLEWYTSWSRGWTNIGWAEWQRTRSFREFLSKHASEFLQPFQE